MINTYAEAEAFFASRAQYGIQPGLKRMYLLLEKIGNPEKHLKAIHIAGTNGKGSTSAFVEQSLLALGYEVGLFTSPSFTGITGHIFLNNKEIDKEVFTRLTSEIEPVVRELDQMDEHPSEFEILTALAFLFYSKQTDFVVVEAGMGGREDTTNCFTPLLSVITNVSLDHTQFLGDSHREIALHKAGIIKKNKPVILGDTIPIVQDVVKKEARKLGAPLIAYGTDYCVTNEDLSKNIFTYQSQKQAEIYKIAMHGIHQMKNAATALAVLEELDEIIEVDWPTIHNVFNGVTLPGRFEQINSNPLIYIDGAHNVAGMTSLIKTIRYYKDQYDVQVLFAGFKDKALDEIVDVLQRNKTQTIITKFDHLRALSKEATIEFATKHGIPYILDWKAWLQTKQEEFTEHTVKPPMYIITGSLHFIMQVGQFQKNMYT